MGLMIRDANPEYTKVVHVAVCMHFGGPRPHIIVSRKVCNVSFINNEFSHDYTLMQLSVSICLTSAIAALERRPPPPPSRYKYR